MKYLVLATVFICSLANATGKMNVNFKNEELATIVESYSKFSGQKFVVDSTVRGKVTILNNEDINASEFFNQLSAALAVNGFAISNQDGIMVIRNARSVQRDFVETSPKVPSLHPTRMYTWVYTFQHVPASDIQKDLRMLVSAYGEMSAVGNTNQLIITDWTPNIVRVAEMLKLVDKPVSANSKKLAAQANAKAKKFRVDNQLKAEKEVKEKTN